MINRAAILLRYKAPAVEWINALEPARQTPRFTLDSINEERTVYLISEADSESPEDLKRWVKKNFRILFESELEAWYLDESYWPKARDFKTFTEWFTVECHTVVLDTAGGEIHDDGS